MTTAPTGFLDSVNDLFMALGREPLATYPSSNASMEETVAVKLLNKYNRAAQTAKDWKFNFAEKVSYTADESGNVIFGSTTTCTVARAILNQTNPPRPTGTIDIDLRLNSTNWQAFDVTNQTFNLGANSTWYFDLTYWRDFTDTPEAFRRYVTARAKAEFLTDLNGARDLVTLAKVEEKEAWAELVQDHIYKAGTKSFDKIRAYRTVFDNYDAARPLRPVPPTITPL